MSEAVFDSYDVAGRIVIATGAGGALVGEMSRCLARAGARMVLVDIRTDQAESLAEDIRNRDGGDAMAFGCDVLDESALKTVCADVITRWGHPHGLINGAGGNHPDGTVGEDVLDPDAMEQQEGESFFDLTADGFRRVFELNMMGTVLPTRVFARAMLHRRTGSIVNISSMSADRPLTRIPAYSAAKAGVSNFTGWCSTYFARAGIRVNALAPGFFQTEQSKFLQWDPQTGEPTQRTLRIFAGTPLGRYGKPGELFGAVRWLLSDSSLFVTGAVIPIDGGFSSYAI